MKDDESAVDMELLRAACTRLRDAIERCEPKPTEGLMNFPRGACGIASEILVVYLKSEGFGDFEYTVVEKTKRGRHWSHAWVTQGDITVDITADQFPDQDRAVIVGRDSTYHSKLGKARQSKMTPGGEARIALGKIRRFLSPTE